MQGCFFIIIMNYKLDRKKEWYKYRKKYYIDIHNCNTISKEDKLFCNRHRDEVIYENPKTFTDGVAFNDGTWVVFNTIRVKNGKERTNILVRTSEGMVKTLYSYMSFLKIAGIRQKNLMVYFTLTFFDRLTFGDKVFECNDRNKGILHLLAEKVLKKPDDEITRDWTRGGKLRTGCWDDRKFCIDTTGLTKEEIIKKQNQIMNRKQNTDRLIEENRLEGKSIKENVEHFKELGLKVSRARYCSWLSEHKGAVQNEPLCNGNRFAQPDSDINPEFLKTESDLDDLLGSWAVQNDPHSPEKSDEKGCPKRHITLSKDKGIDYLEDNPEMSLKKKKESLKEGELKSKSEMMLDLVLSYF